MRGSQLEPQDPGLTTHDSSLMGSIVPPRGVRVLLGAYWLAVVYGTLAVVPRPSDVRDTAAWAATLVALIAFTVATLRSGEVHLLLLSGLAGVAMQALAPSNGAFVAVIATIAVAGIRLDPAWGRAIAGVCGGGFLIASAVSDSPRSIFSAGVGLFFTYLASTAVRRLRIEQVRTAELLEEVIAGRDARIRAAALDERTRLAREMHDVLAHTLSALSIQLEGTWMLAEQRSADPAIVSALDRARGLAREGLTEARRAVGSLRDEALPGPDLLPHLAHGFEEDTGVPCHLQVDGEPVELSAETRLTLYRITQEALTNVRKHADASSVDVTLRYAADGIELTVEDEGTPSATPLEGGSYGMRGMRERAKLLGGRVEAGPTMKGFRVWLWMPNESRQSSVSRPATEN